MSSVSRRGRRCAAWRRLGLDERRPGRLRVAERKLRERAIGLESTVEGKFTGGELSGEQQNGGGLLLGVNGVCVREAARKVWHGCSLSVVWERE